MRFLLFLLIACILAMFLGGAPELLLPGILIVYLVCWLGFVWYLDSHLFPPL